MSDPSDISMTGYDIQGQFKKDGGDAVHVPPTGYSAPGAYSSHSKYSSPAGEGENIIPATAPGLQDPIVPGKEKTELQTADLSPQAPVKKDPLTSAITANEAALRSAGVITVSQAEENAKVLSKGVMGAVPSSGL